ncbi:MAG: isoaspartyl peptidase/L-asparaginase [Methylobacteriaceae bacterium]|jgi:beta-aspartyl-peptidase (threonine type)|nr:isoaspartyl peptidase/L-asparaginase [Methylobacteriaceae bacterium]
MSDKPVKPVLVIHGGAGAITREESTPEKIRERREALLASLKAGYAVLKQGGSALDAVEQAVLSMEDCPLFNCGRGACLTSEGTIEHDASIMDGRTRAAGALSGSRRVRNPISAARAIMERTPHIHLTGDGVELFAREQGLALAPEWYFYTPERLEALRRIQAAKGQPFVLSEKDRHGTVGAVARDADGNLAAATSTGGYANKLPGRVGDSAHIGAGTFADNATVAASGTGHGETFMRVVMGHRLSDLVELTGQSLDEAATAVINDIGRFGATGGLIAVDARGGAVMKFNSPGMYRGIAEDDTFKVAIFGDEEVS